MVSWWVRYSHFNNEQVQISDDPLINAAYDSSGSFGSRYVSKCIVHNTYTGRRINFHSFSGVSTILISIELCRRVSWVEELSFFIFLIT